MKRAKEAMEVNGFVLKEGFYYGDDFVIPMYLTDGEYCQISTDGELKVFFLEQGEWIGRYCDPEWAEENLLPEEAILMEEIIERGNIDEVFYSINYDHTLVEIDMEKAERVDKLDAELDRF